MNIHELRYGNHVLCGSLAEYIPKQICRVGIVRRDLIGTIVDVEHPDFDEYTATECEGVTITPTILLDNGWVQSKLNPNRYIYAKKGVRFVWTQDTKNASAISQKFVTCSGVEWLHQLENIIIDSGSKYTFNL